MNGNIFVSHKVFGSYTASELLKKTTLEKARNPNDRHCMDPCDCNHVPPNPRYFVIQFGKCNNVS